MRRGNHNRLDPAEIEMGIVYKETEFITWSLDDQLTFLAANAGSPINLLYEIEIPDTAPPEIAFRVQRITSFLANETLPVPSTSVEELEGYIQKSILDLLTNLPIDT